EVAAGRGRRPHVLLDAEGGAARRPVYHLDCDEPDLLVGADRAERAPRRHHRFEKRQRDGDSHPFEDRAARQLLVRQEHSMISYRDRSSVTSSVVFVLGFIIRNAGLLTMPRMYADQRLSFFDASRMMPRMVGMSVYSTRRPSAYVIRFSVKLRRIMSWCFSSAACSPEGPSIFVPS